ncbi:MAG: TetR/AcrR family transcriptional regulator [Planctomycetota bacterium]|jgi:AcrR family transcriptional regulator
MPARQAATSATEPADGGDSAVATASRDRGRGAAPPGPTEKKKGKKRRGGTSPGKRERILAAAAELFAGKDYHRVLIDEVARRAEVGKGTVYRHFETKEDLFVAVLSYAVDLATERLRAKIERASDPVEQLRVACKQALRFFRENGHPFHVLNHAKALRCARGRKDLNQKREGLRRFVEDVLVDGREERVFDLADAAFASTILWGMIRTTLRNSPDDTPLDEMSHKIVALFTKGIIRRGADSPDP